MVTTCPSYVHCDIKGSSLRLTLSRFPSVSGLFPVQREKSMEQRAEVKGKSTSSPPVL